MAGNIVKWWKHKILGGYKQFSVLQECTTDSEELVHPVRTPSSCSAPPDLLLVSNDSSKSDNQTIVNHNQIKLLSSQTTTTTTTASHNNQYQNQNQHNHQQQQQQHQHQNSHNQKIMNQSKQHSSNTKSQPNTDINRLEGITSGRNDTRIQLDEFTCDVSVEGGKSSQPLQFSFTFYDLDGHHGKITKDDIVGIVYTIYESIGKSVVVPHFGSKTINVRLTVSPENDEIMKSSSTQHNNTKLNTNNNNNNSYNCNSNNKLKKSTTANITSTSGGDVCGGLQQLQQNQSNHINNKRRQHRYRHRKIIKSDDDDDDEDADSLSEKDLIKNLNDTTNCRRQQQLNNKTNSNTTTQIKSISAATATNATATTIAGTGTSTTANTTINVLGNVNNTTGASNTGGNGGEFSIDATPNHIKYYNICTTSSNTKQYHHHSSNLSILPLSITNSLPLAQQQQQQQQTENSSAGQDNNPSSNKLTGYSEYSPAAAAAELAANDIYESMANLKYYSKISSSRKIDMIDDVGCKECIATSQNQHRQQQQDKDQLYLKQISSRAKLLRKSRKHKERNFDTRQRSLSVGNETSWNKIKTDTLYNNNNNNNNNHNHTIINNHDEIDGHTIHTTSTTIQPTTNECWNNALKRNDLIDIIRESMEKNRLCFQTNGKAQSNISPPPNFRRPRSNTIISRMITDENYSPLHQHQHHHHQYTPIYQQQITVNPVILPGFQQQQQQQQQTQQNVHKKANLCGYDSFLHATICSSATAATNSATKNSSEKQTQYNNSTNTVVPNHQVLGGTMTATNSFPKTSMVLTSTSPENYYSNYYQQQQQQQQHNQSSKSNHQSNSIVDNSSDLLKSNHKIMRVSSNNCEIDGNISVSQQNSPQFQGYQRLTSSNHHYHHNHHHQQQQQQPQQYQHSDTTGGGGVKLNTTLLQSLNPQLSAEERLNRTIDHVGKWLIKKDQAIMEANEFKNKLKYNGGENSSDDGIILNIDKSKLKKSIKNYDNLLYTKLTEKLQQEQQIQLQQQQLETEQQKNQATNSINIIQNNNVNNSNNKNVNVTNNNNNYNSNTNQNSNANNNIETNRKINFSLNNDHHQHHHHSNISSNRHTTKSHNKFKRKHLQQQLKQQLQQQILIRGIENDKNHSDSSHTSSNTSTNKTDINKFITLIPINVDPIECENLINQTSDEEIVGGGVVDVVDEEGSGSVRNNDDDVLVTSKSLSNNDKILDSGNDHHDNNKRDTTTNHYNDVDLNEDIASSNDGDTNQNSSNSKNTATTSSTVHRYVHEHIHHHYHHFENNKQN